VTSKVITLIGRLASVSIIGSKLKGEEFRVSVVMSSWRGKPSKYTPGT
jgi:hypothetical protein